MNKSLFFTLAVGFFLIMLIFPLISAAHYIIGYVNDARDGAISNDHSVMLWNPYYGTADNVTDVIGVNGDSNVDRAYMFDCEMLTNGCNVGDILSIRVFDNGDDYVSEIINLTVSGAGYDLVNNLTLNSPPNVTQSYPVDNVNTSALLINFNCSSYDLDGNLHNISLWGDWDLGWHLNETKPLSGTSGESSFTKSIPSGTYKWACEVFDNLSVFNYSYNNYTINVDREPPIISNVSLNESFVCGTNSYIRVSCSAIDYFTDLEEVKIEAVFNGTRNNYSTTYLLGDYYTDILINSSGDWYFNCYARDYAGNINSTNSDILKAYTQEPDLGVYSGDINFSDLNPIENEIIVIGAIIHNTGCSDANNFLAGFYEQDPDISGIQIGSNQYVNITSLSNVSVNISWSAQIGKNNIFVKIDLEDVYEEINESDNKANKTLAVGAWQVFYGNLSIENLISNLELQNMSLWSNISGFQGNVFVADSESVIDWLSLQALGKDVNGATTLDDFLEIDTCFLMESFDDSVYNTFTNFGTPTFYENFSIHSQEITNVPVINSTDNSNFITGILWDKSDDSDGEYGPVDKEDIVFVSEVNKGMGGKYGLYDYELTIPVRLREYNISDTTQVYFYYDLY